MLIVKSVLCLNHHELNSGLSEKDLIGRCFIKRFVDNVALITCIFFLTETDIH